MKISLITTIYNESKTIESFIEAIEKQSISPNQVIIVDAGSKDNTLKILKTAIEKFGQPKKYNVVTKKGASRSLGRNIAISKAKNDIIAVVDAGCIPAEDWLAQITLPFKDSKVMAVAGYYLPKTGDIFQKCLAPFVCVMPDKLDKHFLPSSRSLAFRKKVWLKTGGYPEELNYCEDLVFDQKILKSGFKFNLADKAIVYWPQRNNIFEAFKQFYFYAYGDGQVFLSPYQTHSSKILMLFLRYFGYFVLSVLALVDPRVWPVLVGLILFFLLLPLFKYFKYVKDLRAIIIIPIIKIVADIAVMFGSFSGFLKGRFL